MLYSDGLVETRYPAGDEFGYERLAAAVARHRALAPDDLRDALLHDLYQFAGHDAWDDDLTLVVVKWNGRTEPVHADVTAAHARHPA